MWVQAWEVKGEDMDFRICTFLFQVRSFVTNEILTLLPFDTLIENGFLLGTLDGDYRKAPRCQHVQYVLQPS